MDTSGINAGKATSFWPVKGHSMVLAALYLKVSDPSMFLAGRNGSPMAAALSLHERAPLVHSTHLTLPDSTALLPALERPQVFWAGDEARPFCSPR